MFLVDKYNISDIDDIIIHKDIYTKLVIGANYQNRLHDINELQQIIETKSYDQIDRFHLSKPKIYSNYESMPNLLIHGPPGCGKHTLIKLLLNDIFDDSINDVFTEKYFIKGYGNTVVDVDIEQSKYHLIIEPNNTGLDKYLIQEIVKEYAKKKIINISYNKFPFRVVLINNIDNLHYYAQTSLRCTMEKYHKTCRFILCGSQISKIIEPIKSRCLDVRISSPSKDDMLNLIYHILLNEKKLLSRKKIDKIIDSGELNIKRTIWILEMSLFGIKDYELSWRQSLDKIIEMMIGFKDPKALILNDKIIPNTRTILYKIFTTNIPGIEILHEIIKKTIASNQFDTEILYQIIQTSSENETRLNKGKRSIIHLDSFMCKVYELIYNYYHKSDKSIKSIKAIESDKVLSV
jgi:replication factor C subunit 3/5